MTHFQILAPSPDVVYHKGDTMGVTVQYAVTYLCDTIYVRDTIIEDYSINTSSLSPDKHYLYAVGRLENGEEVKDSIPVWVVEFTLRENLVDRYFTPLKSDSAKIPYRLLPEEYADPTIDPKPLSFQVEIKDKDGTKVYGARELTNEEQQHQILYWNGKNNDNNYTDPEKSPYEVKLILEYKNGEIIEKETAVINVPYIEYVEVVGRNNLILKPENGPIYTDLSYPIWMTAVILAKVSEGDMPINYRCYRPGYSITTFNKVMIKKANWYLPVEFNVEGWESIWGSIDHIRWVEVMPKIIDDDEDMVGYSDSLLRGEWYSPINGWGWSWSEHQRSLEEGSYRYRVYVENKILPIISSKKIQDKKTPKGIDMSRVSVRGNYGNDVVNWTSSYLRVPYVLGYHRNEYGQMIVKGLHKGYEGTDCSGLACWAFIWAGEPLSSLNPSYPTDSSALVNNTGATMLHGYEGQPQHVVIYVYNNGKDTLSSDDDVDWDGFDDADKNKDGIISAGTEMTILQRKLDLAEPGDMWFIDYNSDGLGEGCDHVGIYFTKVVGGEAVGRIIEASGSKDEVRTTDSDDQPNPKKSWYWNGIRKKSIFRGLRRRTQ